MALGDAALQEFQDGVGPFMVVVVDLADMRPLVRGMAAEAMEYRQSGKHSQGGVLAESLESHEST
jgi:hypothetical protein